MARGRGGSSRGGSSSGSGSSSSTCRYGDNPCHFTITELYGHSYGSLYSNSELYGQLVVYIIWAIVLILLLLRTFKPASKARWLQGAISLFLASFIFLCVRFGLLIAENDIPVGYRYETSVVVLLQRLGAVFLFAAVFVALQTKKLFAFVFWPLLAMYAILSIAYLSLDFVVSAGALRAYKEEGIWLVGDRDFGVTLTANQIEELKTSAIGGALSPYYIASKMFSSGDEEYFRDRGNQVKIGVAMDFLSVFMAIFLGLLSCFAWIRKKQHPIRETILLLLASTGLFLYSLFRVIVSTHFVLRNRAVITDTFRWNAFIASYTTAVDTSETTIIPEGFLRGYRTTANGFPVVQAVLEFLGVILACTAIVGLLGLRRRAEAQAAAGTLGKA